MSQRFFSNWVLFNDTWPPFFRAARSKQITVECDKCSFDKLCKSSILMVCLPFRVTLLCAGSVPAHLFHTLLVTNVPQFKTLLSWIWTFQLNFVQFLSVLVPFIRFPTFFLFLYFFACSSLLPALLRHCVSFVHINFVWICVCGPCHVMKQVHKCSSWLHQLWLESTVMGT